ncbi:four-carbon acid sugar kinase family protein [Streptomyces sp. NPDC058486]|uniref:four-carbon acid sugar kinase family protein n=1 Tax=unclassified Streptomyces TaxID=2593676 RepID=UPI003654219F
MRSGIVILADDLTSAGDGAAPFRRAGHEARILLSVPGLLPRNGATDVAAIDLGSRVLDEGAAALRTERAARLFSGSGLLFKTVDSTLRGHVAAEVRAAWAGSGRRAVVIAPAFPGEERMTVAGVQYVRGVPVHESDFARDPVHPVRCSDLAALFPEAVQVGSDRAAELPELIGRGGLIVCSAASDGDLDRLVERVPRLGDVLWVGSPGLAAALARACARAGGAVPVPEPALRPLFVVGSANPAALRQVAALRRRGDVQGVTVGGDPERAVESLSRSTAPVLTLQMPGERRAPQAARALARSLAAVVRGLAEEQVVDALVVTGGETAATVLPALGATCIRLVDEPEPGVARGSLLGPLPLPVLIKAGGFGDDALLLRLCRLIRHPVDRHPVDRHPLDQGEHV